jgi:hypothetical protein
VLLISSFTMYWKSDWHKSNTKILHRFNKSRLNATNLVNSAFLSTTRMNTLVKTLAGHVATSGARLK